MPTEPTRVVLHLDRGPLPAGVVHTAVQFQASQAGVESKTGGKFARACEDVARETLSQLIEGDAGLDVTVDTFADRMEISIQHRGQQEPAVVEAFVHAEGPSDGSSGLDRMELLEQVDRVMFNTEGGVARTTLVKFLKPKN